MPSLFLLLGRWSFCCSSPHFRGTEVVMLIFLNNTCGWIFYILFYYKDNLLVYCFSTFSLSKNQRVQLYQGFFSSRTRNLVSNSGCLVNPGLSLSGFTHKKFSRKKTWNLGGFAKCLNNRDCKMNLDYSLSHNAFDRILN